MKEVEISYWLAPGELSQTMVFQTREESIDYMNNLKKEYPSLVYLIHTSVKRRRYVKRA